MIRLVPLHEIDVVWPVIADQMESGCIKARSNLSPIDLYRGVRIGSGYLFLIDDGRGAAIVEIRNENGGRVCDVIGFCGRELDDWLPELLNSQWLDMMKVTRFIAEGRSGLAERLKEFIPNLRVTRQVMEWDRGHAA